jgi:hypothetical protein
MNADRVVDPTPVEPANDPAPASDLRDSRIAELESRLAQYDNVITRLQPYHEDITFLDSDEDGREFLREARRTYVEQREARRKAAEPKLDPNAQALVEAFYERVKPSLEFVDKLRERETPEYAQQEQAKAQTAAFVRQNEEYAQRLVAEHGLTENDVLDVVAFANALHEREKAQGRTRFVGLEEAWKKMAARAQAAAPTSPARSLRAHSAAPGIPAASKPQPTDRKELRRPGGVTKHVLDVLNKQKKGA